MAKLSDLGLTNEGVGEALDYATMPDQLGTFAPPPQPATFRFKFPNRMDDLWETFDHPTGKPPGKRLRAKFDDSHPLVIVQSADPAHLNEPFLTSLTNAERKRKRGKREDATAPFISDLDYIFRDVFGLPGKPAGGNVGYAQELLKHPGEEFTADLTWSWYCNEKKTIYVDNGQGGLQEVPNQMGCGTGYYQRDVQKVLSDPQDPKSALIYPLRITCSCGGNVRAFANLQNFRK